MKQNERLLVYAVTGFLALILVVAVLFSREPGKDGASPNKPQGLNEILGQDGKGDGKVGKANVTGLPGPDEVSLQPLAANAPKAMLATDLVAQQLGMSRRDRTVRFVRAKQNDTLDLLVRRWCGARDPYLAETKSLNEELTVLHVGQEVAVPWVDDEVVLAAIEASKPKTLLAQDAVAGGNTPKAGTPEPANAGGPSFAQPGSGSGQSGSKSSPVGDATAHKVAGGTSYTVKEKDSLWRIAERTYGKKNADRMIPAIKEANPGLTPESLKIGQKIVLPAAPAGGA
jgi:LysM repeat protein